MLRMKIRKSLTTILENSKNSDAIATVGGRKSPHLLFFVIVFLILTITVVFGRALGFSFVWDDIIVLNNSIATIRGYTIFRGSGSLWGYYRPLISLFYMFDYSIWGRNPTGYHLTNLLLYLATVISVSLVIYKVWNNERAAFIGGLCFVLLSTHVESVAWISGRTDIISGLFLFLSLLAFLEYIESERKIALWLTAIFALFSMWGKETGVVYFVLIPILGWVKKYKIDFTSFLILLLPLIVYFILRMNVIEIFAVPSQNKFLEGTSQQGYRRVLIFLVKPTFWNILLQILKAIGFYLWRVVWPFKLRLFYYKTLPEILYCVFSAVYFVSLIISFLKRNRPVFFALIWFLLTLAPSLILSVIYLSATPVADRYVFIPSFSVAFLWAYLYHTLGKKLWLKIATVVFLLAHLYATTNRLAHWKNNETLWEVTYKQSPTNPMAIYWYAKVCYETGRIDEAESILRKNIRNRFVIAPLKASSYALLAGIKFDKHQLDSTFFYADEALSITPLAKAYFYKAVAFLEKYHLDSLPEWLDSAEVNIQKAMDSLPYNMAIRYAAAKIYLEKKDKNRAIEQLNFIIENDPYSPYAKKAIFLMEKMEHSR